MKKVAVGAFLLACLALHARPTLAATNPTPGVAATGAVSALTAPITGSSSPQTVALTSSVGCTVNGFAQVMDASPELTQITAVPDSVHITATFLSNHAAGANVVCTLSTGGATSNQPFAGGATGVANGPNQGVAVFGQNPSGTNDYIGENGNAMYVITGQGSYTSSPAMLRVCDHHAQLNSAGALTTQVVAPVAGHQIGLCGYSMSASGVNSMKIVEGTHTTNDCDTGQSDVVTTQYSSGVGWGKTVLQPYVAMNSSSNTWLLPVGAQLCLTSTQTVPWTLEVWYAII